MHRRISKRPGRLVHVFRTQTDICSILFGYLLIFCIHGDVKFHVFCLGNILNRLLYFFLYLNHLLYIILSLFWLYMLDDTVLTEDTFILRMFRFMCICFWTHLQYFTKVQQRFYGNVVLWEGLTVTVLRLCWAVYVCVCSWIILNRCVYSWWRHIIYAYTK